MIYSTQPKKKEKLFGYIYLFIDLFVLPLVLGTVNGMLPVQLTSGQLNFVYYFINLAVILAVFRKFLFQSLKDALRAPFANLWYGLLGYMGSNVLTRMLTVGLLLIFPSFANINDQAVGQILREDFALMAVGTILLVPIAEETLFRGLIFRGLYDRSPVAAYLVSMTAFAAMHVAGYIGQAEPLTLLLCFLQYLPAGYCLCFAYRRSGTILSPIVTHMIVNAMAVYAMR